MGSEKAPGFVALTTDRLLLRRFDLGDAEDFFAYRSDAGVTRFQGWKPENVEEMRHFIAGQAEIAPDTPDTWFQLAVCLRAGGELIGDCGLRFPLRETWQAEIGYTIAPRHQRRGYALEAVRALLAFLFDTLGKHRVYASLDPRNTASVRLLERLGMRREAWFKASIPEDTGWADDVVYALLKREWRQY
jgi:RimJ/RimL family protein N-acetyltransferase